jgi:hypothetical protein
MPCCGGYDNKTVDEKTVNNTIPPLACGKGSSLPPI